MLSGRAAGSKGAPVGGGGGKVGSQVCKFGLVAEGVRTGAAAGLETGGEWKLNGVWLVRCVG